MPLATADFGANRFSDAAGRRRQEERHSRRTSTPAMRLRPFVIESRRERLTGLDIASGRVTARNSRTTSAYMPSRHFITTHRH
jgi:hypothetical protein